VVGRQVVCSGKQWGGRIEGSQAMEGQKVGESSASCHARSGGQKRYTRQAPDLSRLQLQPVGNPPGGA